MEEEKDKEHLHDLRDGGDGEWERQTEDLGNYETETCQRYWQQTTENVQKHCNLTHSASNLDFYPCEWWAQRVADPCCFFGLYLTRPHSLRPDHQTLAIELASWFPCSRLGDSKPKGPIHLGLPSTTLSFVQQWNNSEIINEWITYCNCTSILMHIQDFLFWRVEDNTNDNDETQKEKTTKHKSHICCSVGGCAKTVLTVQRMCEWGVNNGRVAILRNSQRKSSLKIFACPLMTELIKLPKRSDLYKVIHGFSVLVPKMVPNLNHNGQHCYFRIRIRIRICLCHWTRDMYNEIRCFSWCK